MAFKTIATFIKDSAIDQDVLATAIDCAYREDAHLSVICLGIDRIQPGAYYAGANAVAIQQSLGEAQEAADAAETFARETLSGHTISWDVTAFTVPVAALGHLAASRTQMADLIVLPKPYGANRSMEDVATLEAALFGTRVPLVIVPEGLTALPPPKTAVLAWNESAESLAAIRMAIPLLRHASSVNIAIIDPPTHGADRSDPGGPLAEMLSRHGVKADISVLAKTMPRISDVLCRHIADRDAELLVMGAYGHSRFREAILGGATRNMLEMAEVPLFMTH